MKIGGNYEINRNKLKIIQIWKQCENAKFIPRFTYNRLFTNFPRKRGGNRNQ